MGLRSRNREKVRQLVNTARNSIPVANHHLNSNERDMVDALNNFAEAIELLADVCESMDRELNQKADRSDRD